MTSNDAALSVPDWPLSWGRLIPPLEGGIRFEFAHRVLAALVGILTAILAFSLRRPLAWLAFGTVVAQALLGGALVKLIDPKSLAIAHATLGQICFGLVVAVALRQPTSGAGKSRVPALAVAAILIQTVLGAALRHNVIGLVPHIAGAVLAIAAVMWASLQILVQDTSPEPRRRAAVLLLGLIGLQLFLGFAAYTAMEANAGAPQPMPLVIWTTVAHVVVGALALGAAICLTE